MSSDIFREVELNENERDYHRYIIHNKITIELEDWRMKSLTFGVASSLFLATQVLRSVADANQEEYPKAADIVRRSFYMDDCLTGSSSLTEAIQLWEELNDFLDRVCMCLRKWRSNSPDLLQSIPDKIREETVQVIAPPEQCYKALEVHRDTIHDNLHVATPTLDPDDRPTKRQVASDVVHTFGMVCSCCHISQDHSPESVADPIGMG